MSRHFEDNPPCIPARQFSSSVLVRTNELCMAARRARVKLAIKLIPACPCGSPAVVNGRCRGCDEDSFYSRHIPGAKLEGAE